MSSVIDRVVSGKAKAAAPTWTPEQSTIFLAAKDTPNLMISALAGTGKTTTLEQVQLVTKTKPILYLVFNKKNADEATNRMLSTTTVRTFNSLGHRIWGSTGRSISLNAKKTPDIYRELIKESPKTTQVVLWAVYDQVISGVGLAKSLGYVPPSQRVEGLIPRATFHSLLEERPDDLVSDLIDAVLTRSIAQALVGTIDFNDQVYMPALWGGTFPKFPLVMVDEYQDLSPVNHKLLSRLVTRRVIGVGDPWQNIYGFRGAHAQGMDTAREKFQMVGLDLSISFRCPEAIVRHVRPRVPHFRASRPGGSVHTLHEMDASHIRPDSTIICRNNAPLFALAFRLLSHGHSVSVSGTDIGPRLIAMMRRLGSEEMTRPQTLSAINDWEAEKLANESRTAADMAACMRIFASHGSSLGQSIQYAEHLFKQDGTIKLMTGHKSKGLEFPDVIHLDPWLCADTEQDQNLRYVISTRSSDRLTEIDSGAIKWQQGSISTHVESPVRPAAANGVVSGDGSVAPSAPVASSPNENVKPSLRVTIPGLRRL